MSRFVLDDLAGIRLAPRGGASAHSEEAAVPAVAQQTAWTCGPAALTAVARRFGIMASEGSLHDLMDVSEDAGASPDQMLAGARRLGLAVAAREGWTLPELERALIQGRPVIACLQLGSPTATPAIEDRIDAAKDANGEAGHWCVFTGRQRGVIEAMDPATGETVEMAKDDLPALWIDRDDAGRTWRRFGIEVRGRLPEGGAAALYAELERYCQEGKNKGKPGPCPGAKRGGGGGAAKPAPKPRAAAKPKPSAAADARAATQRGHDKAQKEHAAAQKAHQAAAKVESKHHATVHKTGKTLESVKQKHAAAGQAHAKAQADLKAKPTMANAKRVGTTGKAVMAHSAALNRATEAHAKAKSNLAEAKSKRGEHAAAHAKAKEKLAQAKQDLAAMGGGAGAGPAASPAAGSDHPAPPAAPDQARRVPTTATSAPVTPEPSISSGDQLQSPHPRSIEAALFDPSAQTVTPQHGPLGATPAPASTQAALEAKAHTMSPGDFEAAARQAGAGHSSAALNATHKAMVHDALGRGDALAKAIAAQHYPEMLPPSERAAKPTAKPAAAPTAAPAPPAAAAGKGPGIFGRIGQGALDSARGELGDLGAAAGAIGRGVGTVGSAIGRGIGAAGGAVGRGAGWLRKKFGFSEADAQLYAELSRYTERPEARLYRELSRFCESRN